ncbi:MerR family transcriptional regulator [Saccharomonospora sp. NPDC006951]
MPESGLTLRPVDLARLAGVSTQQIRNYVEAGVLPAAPRSPSGYREFGEAHRRALLTFRELGPAYGWDTARTVMRRVHEGDRASALAELDAAHAAVHEQRLTLATTGKALEAVAGESPDDDAVPRAGVSIGKAAATLGVRTSALRVWEAEGLLSPARTAGTKYRRFGSADLRDARMIRMLRQGHYPLARIKPVLDGLRATGSSEALRAAIAQRRTELAARSAAMLAASCALHHYLTGHDPLPRE